MPAVEFPVPPPRERTGTGPRMRSSMIIVAHRGASAYAPENTLAALREAHRRGADMAELDVRQTADGAFVVMHDPTLRRTTNAGAVFPERRPWRVCDFTLAEIRRLDAGSWYGPAFAGEPVPTLEEALETLKDNGLGALVELKVRRRDPAAALRLIGRIAADPHWRGAGADSRLILQSFDWTALRGIAEHLPGARTAVLGTTYSRLALRRVARYASQVNPHHLRVSAPYVRHVHEHGLTMFSWTVNTDSAIRRVIRDGVDGIISDYPDRVAGHLAVAA
ncbi:glycerophosphoryl diester phosphodiesterase [Spinactinospora alkalitolerans]|uniref:Glycerophosphoryl diester phosphodiesterase n=1 Tax=Spinactinospora alkalitolerans TaxID=687207 RepID=A0A852U5R0_9ACTN|nr:glycerophosphodiester phosphodiesterase family protein [Spinactinospora alkalitolerans]NYE49250.1 glycerophosphoryl diester phosphodiesterase [Spinactinospora alkalitolerans]